MVYLENTKKSHFGQAVKANALSFFETLKSGPDFPYFLLVVFYIATEYSKRINWNSGVFSQKESNFLNIVVIFGSGAYLCYKLIMWKKMWNEPAFLVLTVLIVMGASGWLFVYLDEDWNTRRVTYTVVFEIYLCLMAYGKNYKRLLQWILIVPVLTLAIAGLGLLLNFTTDLAKSGQADNTRSLGIIYPNTWGYIAFQAMLIVWHLYLKKNSILPHLLTFALFWGLSAFLYFVIGCRTIALLTAAFPLVSWITVWLESRERKPGKKPGVISWLFIGLPVICFALTMALNSQIDWVGKTFYSTPLHSMAMRFVQGGIALEHFGLSLFGRPLRTTELVTRMVNGTSETLYVMDNAYSSFIISKGVLWMAGWLALLTAAQWKSWKYRDYSILIIGGFMVVFALMERPGIELWYNFVLLYPLASVKEPLSHKGELRKYLFGEKKHHHQK